MYYRIVILFLLSSLSCDITRPTYWHPFESFTKFNDHKDDCPFEVMNIKGEPNCIPNIGDTADIGAVLQVLIRFYGEGAWGSCKTHKLVEAIKVISDKLLSGQSTTDEKLVTGRDVWKVYKALRKECGYTQNYNKFKGKNEGRAYNLMKLIWEKTGLLENDEFSLKYDVGYYIAKALTKADERKKIKYKKYKGNNNSYCNCSKGTIKELKKIHKNINKFKELKELFSGSVMSLDLNCIIDIHEEETSSLICYNENTVTKHTGGLRLDTDDSFFDIEDFNINSVQLTNYISGCCSNNENILVLATRNKNTNLSGYCMKYDSSVEQDRWNFYNGVSFSNCTGFMAGICNLKQNAKFRWIENEDSGKYEVDTYEFIGDPSNDYDHNKSLNFKCYQESKYEESKEVSYTEYYDKSKFLFISNQ